MAPPVADKQIDVLCIGNAIVDVLAHADDAFLAAHDMVKGTMRLIDDDAVHRLYADMPPAMEASGGSAANTAAGVASFGGTSAFVGKVAADDLGDVFTHDIRAAGVSFEPLQRVDGLHTARCLIIVTPDAQRTLNTYLGVSSLIGPSDIDQDLVGTAQVVLCEGYLWDLPQAKAAMRTAMDVAREAGSKVAFSLSDPFCVDRHRAEFLELAEDRVDMLFANEIEICSLYETDSFDDAAAHVAGHCEIACLTRSEKGAVIITETGQRVDVPAQRVDTVVDTTGAGDLYAAGFLYGYTGGRSLEESGRLGALAAAEVISHLGPRPEVALSSLSFLRNPRV